MDIEKLLIDTLGEPTSREAVASYIDFVTMPRAMDEDYSEIHHILPRSKFPEHIDEHCNLVKLSYSDHIEAHKLLAAAYPIKSFLRPLNFMLSDESKNHFGYRDKLSVQTKLWWESFRTSPEYNHWREKRSKYMRRVMLDGRSVLLSNIRYSDQQARNDVSTHFKALWADPDFRKARLAAMIEYHSRPEVKAMRSEMGKQMWANRPADEAERLKQHLRDMQSMHNRDVAISNKLKWQDPEFREKMTKRKTRGPDGSAMKIKWQDPEFREKMSQARKRRFHEANER